MKNKFDIISNIEDKKLIYKIDNSEAIKLNDIKGDVIEVVGYIFKTYNQEIEYNEDGTLKQEPYTKTITLLVDNDDKVYVTASKIFANDLQEMLQYFEDDEEFKKGFKIKITEKTLSKSKNKALGFELQ